MPALASSLSAHLVVVGFAVSYSFSTCKKSNSTGVARPKIVTITFNVFRSVFTSSTTPLKLANGPSLIRT